MCDFAADAEAAQQLPVGRVLTVERVRQLNAKSDAQGQPGDAQDLSGNRE